MMQLIVGVAYSVAAVKRDQELLEVSSQVSPSFPCSSSIASIPKPVTGRLSSVTSPRFASADGANVG